MQALIQRVSKASVRVDGKVVAQINTGLLVLAAVMKTDTEAEAKRMSERLLAYRVFTQTDLNSDQTPSPEHATRPSARMEHNIVSIGGELLMVPQFTLGADVRKGTRPSFHPLADPGSAARLFTLLCDLLEKRVPTYRGVFGAHMQVELTNDGPVTFLLQS